MAAPFLEVMGCVSVFPVEEGQRHELVGRHTFRIDRFSGDLPLPHARVSRKHARLQFVNNAWLAIDEDSTNGTLVNGRNANPAIRLWPGDVIDIAGVLILRFGTPPPRHEELERHIADLPNDEGRWRVWQDWLFEQNDPLAAWLDVKERPLTERASLLGPLAKAFKAHELRCSWNRLGFVTEMTVPFHAMGELPNTLWVLRHLDTVPAARFLTSLTFELLPMALVEQTPPAVTLVEALATAPLPRSLRHLRFSGQLPSNRGAVYRAMSDRPAPARIEAALAQLRRRCPHLETTEKTLITWQATHQP